MKKNGITAAELMARLNASPEFVGRRAREEAARQEREAEWRRAEAPLVEELRDAGIRVDSAWDLVNTSDPYPQALPILAAHLGRPYPDAVREGIARALAVSPAKFAWPILVRLYHEERSERVKDALAVAIAAVADDELIDDVITLVRNQKHGESRVLLLSALGRSEQEAARGALIELRGDPQLRKEIDLILDGPRADGR